MRFLGRIVWNNLDLKLASLAIALLLWSAVAYEPVSEAGYDVPLHLRNVPASLELSSETPATVQVRLRGPSLALRQISPANLAVSLDLAGFRTPGEHSYHLLPGDLPAPLGVEVVRVVPSQVSVRFEEHAERPVPVRPRLVGNPPSGYRMARYEIVPQTVTVVGPQSRVADLKEVLTDPVDLTGITARTHFRTNVYLPDPFLRVANRPQVRVTVYVERDQSSAGAPGPATSTLAPALVQQVARHPGPGLAPAPACPIRACRGPFAATTGATPCAGSGC